jgi:hypothetical protein
MLYGIIFLVIILERGIDVLKDIKCPNCNELMFNESITGCKTQKATSYEKCLRKCKICGVAYSNSQSYPTIIYDDPQKNIPEVFWTTLCDEKLIYFLKNCFNKVHAESKVNAFTFSTSEDAITWQLFSCLCYYNNLKEFISLIDNDIATSNKADTYLWGRGFNTKDEFLIQKLVEISDVLTEAKNSRTEPDVIIHTDNALIFIEVKVASHNDINENKHIKAYINNTYFSHPQKAEQSQCYELVRNWRIGCELTEKLKTNKFYLVNLVYPNHTSRGESSLLTIFEKSLNTEDRLFKTMTWDKIWDSFCSHDCKICAVNLEQRIKRAIK